MDKIEKEKFRAVLNNMSLLELWEIYCEGRGISPHEAIETILEDVDRDTLILFIEGFLR